MDDFVRRSALSRRRFLALIPRAAAGAAAGAALLATPLSGRASRLRGAPTHGPHGAVGAPGTGSWEHPEPRPGIDGSTVLTAEDLADAPDVVEIYDGIRRIPHIADGIRCHCGCADLPRTRSLLSCYEAGGMARYCEICQGEGRLAIRRAAEGQSLDQIRRAIDARYGSRSG